MDEELAIALVILLGGICFIGGCNMFCFQWLKQQKAETELLKMHSDYHKNNGFTKECDLCKSKALAQFVPKKY